MQKTTNYTAVSSFRREAVKARHKVASLFGRNPWAAIFLILFTVFDTITLYQLWNSFLPPESNVILYILVFSIGLCLNLPASIAGSAIKEATQKLTSRKIAVAILCLALVTFSLLFVLNAFFRIQTRDQLLKIDSGSGLVSMVDDISEETEEEEEEQEEDLAILSGSLVMAVLPFATSIASFIIGWKLSDPLDDKLFQMDKVKVQTQAMIAELRAVLAEVEDVDAYIEEMFEFEESRYAAFCVKIDSQKMVLKQIFRVLLMEAMADPDAISHIEENAQQILQNHGIDLSQVTIHNTTCDNTLIAA